MSDAGERLAVLETQNDAQDRRIAELEKDIECINKDRTKLLIAIVFLLIGLVIDMAGVSLT